MSGRAADLFRGSAGQRERPDRRLCLPLHRGQTSAADNSGGLESAITMPHSPITLGVLTDAVMYLARTDGYLSQRLLYVDQRWLAPLSEDELDEDLRTDLEAIRRVIRETRNTFTLHWAAGTLVTMLLRYAGRLQSDSRR